MSVKREIFRNESEFYFLYEDDLGNFVISILCGGVAMYEIKMNLNSDELQKFSIDGVNYLNGLVDDIRKNSEKYKNRTFG